jgi:hypothetical protein
LVSYLNIDWPWHPLLYLKKYLADQSSGTLSGGAANVGGSNGGATNGGGVRVESATDKGPAEDNEPSQPLPSVDRSSSRQTAPSYPGERYPQTRQRLLTMADVSSLSSAQLRYAINEMYARHGATFPSQPPIEAQFRKFSWYHPNQMLTFEQIEDSFSQIERDNLALLGQVRGMKRN